MLKQLFIQNLALIDRLEARWHPGLNVITGETGAGKSIMLNGLSLVMGKRADSSLMRDKDRKLIVEAEFEPDRATFEPLFEAEDLDFEPETIIRREITPSGKSRAFVNDTPVRLDTLEKLAGRLVDIHSQNQNHLLGRKAFRMQLLDTLANNAGLLARYREAYRMWKIKERAYREDKEAYDRLRASADYRAHQLAELEALDWEMNLEEAEERLKQFEQKERLLEDLALIKQIFEAEPQGIGARWAEARQILERWTDRNDRLAEIAAQWDLLLEQLNDTLLQLDEMADEYRWMDDSRAEELRQKISAYYTLMTKHRVQTQAQLKEMMTQWQGEQNDLSALEIRLARWRQEADEAMARMKELAAELHERRKQAVGPLTEYVESRLRQLGMEHSRLRVEVQPADQFDEWGADRVELALSSDKGKTFGPLHKIASGGEMSRLMLVFKMLIAAHEKWPTVIFDEIDAGVSGDVARQMARMIKELSRHMQVIVITHLPQMAAPADRHFKVYKETVDGQVISRIKELNRDERIREIAEMIEGKPPSESALRHAGHLLENQ